MAKYDDGETLQDRVRNEHLARTRRISAKQWLEALLAGIQERCGKDEYAEKGEDPYEVYQAKVSRQLVDTLLRFTPSLVRKSSRDATVAW